MAVLVTPPADLAVSLDDAKDHLAVRHGEDDRLIERHLKAAIARLDGARGILGRYLVTQTWRYRFAPWWDLRLPVPDVSAVAVSYLDGTDAAIEIDPGEVEILDDGSGPSIDFGGVTPWGSLSSLRLPIVVEVTAGYGAPDDVPFDLQAAILLHVGSLYASREMERDSKFTPSGQYETLIAPHRRGAL